MSDKVTIQVRYFAAARAASGVDEEFLALPAGSAVTDAADAISERHGDKLASVLTACSYLLDGVAVRSLSTRLPDGVQLDVLPPFAGG
jgi:molybdopterin synthase sulfur carrier subunit